MTSSNQKCLRNVLDLVAKNPKLQIMVGPSDRSYDTRHFWAVDSSGKVHDPTRNDYDSYAYGKPFDMKANADFVSSMLEKKAGLAEDGEHKLQGHVNFQGLDIAVENKKGSTRSGVGKDGKPWHTHMLYDYGYIKGTKGKDGESVDVYVGPNKDAEVAYVVHQHKENGKGFDEDKCMLGFNSEEDARKAFLAHYDSPKFLGPISAVPMERLKSMVAEGKPMPKIASAFVSEVMKLARYGSPATTAQKLAAARMMKTAITRAAKEYTKAQQAGDLGTMSAIHQNYTQAGLPMRSGGLVHEGGLEQAVRTGFGNLVERPGQTLHTVSGLQSPQYGWAEKLIKRDSPVASGQGAVDLAKQRMEVTRQAQTLGGDAQKLLAPTHATRVIHGAGGNTGVATYQDYYPNAKTVSAVGRGGDVTGARKMVTDVHSGLVAPLQQQGTTLRDIASVHGGKVVGNTGSIIQTAQGPKLIDHIPALKNTASPVQTLDTPQGSQVVSTNGRTDTSWYPQNNKQMNQLAQSNYAPTAKNVTAPVAKPALATSNTAIAAVGTPYAATQLAPTAASGTRTAVTKPAVTAVAVPKKLPNTMVTAVHTPKPNLARLAGGIRSAVTKVAERSAFATEIEQLARQSNPLRSIVAPATAKYDNDPANEEDDFPSVIPTINTLARQR